MAINLIILDRAHGKDTPGKRSPNRKDKGRFYEWESSKELCKMVAAELDKLGIRYAFTVQPDDEKDMPLGKRVEIANRYAVSNGVKNTLFLSLHHNAAASDDKWHTATGWAAYTSVGFTSSDKYAEVFYKKAEEILGGIGKKIRKDMTDGDSDHEANFYVLRHTLSPAILLEQFFQDTKADVEFLESEEGKALLVKVIVEAIREIVGGI